jgi:hypothetical protein
VATEGSFHHADVPAHNNIFMKIAFNVGEMKTLISQLEINVKFVAAIFR